MLRTSLRVFSMLVVLFAIGGCGGASSGQADVQDKQLSRIAKEASSPYASAVQALYVAYFGRPADPAGLANFESALATAGAPPDIQGLTSAYASNPAVQALIDSFGTSKESQALYGGGTQDFVTAVFQNVLGRAPQSAGLAYWSNAIDSGSLSKGDAALAIMDGALTNSSAQGTIDGQLVDNRLAVAASFTAQVASQGETSLYSGSAAASTVRNMLGTVDSTTDVSAFASTISSTITALESLPSISLVAGNTAPWEPISSPSGMVRDSAGNLYFTNQTGNELIKLAPDGTSTLLAGAFAAGSADGVGASARFNSPSGLAIDSQGNIYVADTGNSTIRMVTQEGIVSTVAGKAGTVGISDGIGSSALFSNPQGVAVDVNGNLYVADSMASTIRKIAPGGVVSTLAGQGGCGQKDGVGSAAQFCNPVSVVVDGVGNLYVVDAGNRMIRKITSDGTASTLAGSVVGFQDGTGAAAQFCNPVGLAFDNSGNLLVSDRGCYSNTNPVNPTIRRVTLTGLVTTVAGNNTAAFVDQTPATAFFGVPQGLAVDGSGNIFVADQLNSSIWEVSSSGVVTVYASDFGVTGSIDGTGASAWFDRPRGIVADSEGHLYVADQFNGTIREVGASGQVTTFAGTPAAYGADQDGTGSTAHFSYPTGLAIDAKGNIYAADAFSGIRVITPSGVTSTLTITAGPQRIVEATDVALDSSGNVYVSDSGSSEILKITPAGVLSVVAGSIGQPGSVDGLGSAARFNSPSALAIDAMDNIYVVDTWNSTIRKIDAFGNVTTIAGSAGSTGFVDGVGAAARFYYPTGIALDSAANMYIADSSNSAIRKVTPAGVVTTVAGSVSGAATVLGALPGAVNQPQYLTLVGDKTLYVTSDNAVLRIQLP